MRIAESNRQLYNMYNVYDRYGYNMRLGWLGRRYRARLLYSLVFLKRAHRFNGPRETLGLVLEVRHPVTLIRIFWYTIAKSQYA